MWPTSTSGKDAFIGRGPERADEDYAVIASTPRSGTTYIKAVLAELGVKAGQENVYTSAGAKLAPPDWLTVEVSGFAGLHPFTNTGPVVHQVRHPLKVISSLATLGLWRGIKDPEVLAEWYCELFANNAAAADWTYRLEDMDPETLETLCDILEVDFDATALDRVPLYLNSRPRKDLTLADLGDQAATVADIMDRFGYADL